MKLLQRYDVQNAGIEALLSVAKILVTDLSLLQGSSGGVQKETDPPFPWIIRKGASSEVRSTALELAIISESKFFLGSTACQKVIDAIHKGVVIYTPFSPIDILPDRYKKRPVSIYNPRKASLVNQYRLIVPRTRYILEVCQFGLLLFFLHSCHVEPT